MSAAPNVVTMSRPPAPLPVWRAVAFARCDQYSSMAREAAVEGAVDDAPDPAFIAELQGGADAIRAMLQITDQPDAVMKARIKGAAEALRALALDIETAEGLSLADEDDRP